MTSDFPISNVKISLNFGDDSILLGRLLLHERVIYFEYDSSFIERDISISPFHLPLREGATTFDRALFEGLPGVFADSLSDGWGRLLFDRHVREGGVSPDALTPLDRLSHVGGRGMGALVYEPDYSEHLGDGVVDLDNVALRVEEVLSGSADDALEYLLALNGSSAGARPKACIGVSGDYGSITHGVDSLPIGYSHWLVKFANSGDSSDAGAIEYVYSLLARGAGVDLPESHFFPSRRGCGYFATRRFDRSGDNRFHMHTACGLLHSDFRVPALDYQDLLGLSMRLTCDIGEVRKMFRLAVFNVLSHNRDDHAKNFSFLMGADGDWRLSPAYDLTFSSGPGGEQSTMVMGEGKAPGIEHLIKLGLGVGFKRVFIDEVIEQTLDSLVGWESLAREYGVFGVNIDLIGRKLGALSGRG